MATEGRTGLKIKELVFVDCGVAVASAPANVETNGRVPGMWVPSTIAAGENLAIAEPCESEVEFRGLNPTFPSYAVSRAFTAVPRLKTDVERVSRPGAPDGAIIKIQAVMHADLERASPSVALTQDIGMSDTLDRARIAGIILR